MIPTPHSLEIESKCRPQPGSDRPQQSQQPGPSLRQQEETDSYLYLLGRPTLKRFLRFVAGRASPPCDKRPLIEQWQAAYEHIRALQDKEAGIADNPRLRKSGPEYRPLLHEVLNDPLIRHSYNTVRTEVAVVELERLVVYQRHIDLTFVEQLKQQLGPAPTAEQIFRTCLLSDHHRPRVKWSRLDHNRFVFISPSNDLRFLGAIPLEPERITGVAPSGNPAGVVGLSIGFGSNLLNAIYAERRLILNNGSHRAYALRELGITHAPCIVQHATSSAELELVAPATVRRSPDEYLKHPRPALLKDYFDPKLHRVFSVQRLCRQIIVRFEVDEAYVPSL